MSPSARDQHSGNPFSTRHVRPGRVEPLDAEGRPLDCGRILDRLEQFGNRGLLLGPHGSGKSTLLGRLIEGLRDRDRSQGRTTILAGGETPRPGGRGGRPDPLRLLRMIGGAPKGSIVCVDGWERLGPPLRLCMATAVRCLGLGLLATAHRPGPLPVLVRMQPSQALLAAIVDRLPCHGGRITAADIESAYDASRGNLREALFGLYDLFEQRASRTRLRA